MAASRSIDVAHAGGEPAGRVVGDVEGDRDGQRRGDQQRDDRGEQRAEEQRARCRPPRPSPPGMSSAGAVSAGHASMIRKAATPARTSRIRMPGAGGAAGEDAVARRRRGLRPGRARVVRWWWSPLAPSGRAGLCVACAGRPTSARRPGTSGGRPGPRSRPADQPAAVIASTTVCACVAQGVGDRRAAGGVGRGLLALLADHVGLERLDRVGLRLVVVLRRSRCGS